jgi:hypothetical protein
MPSINQDSLFILIKSLSKSEKRQFKLYAKRLEVNNEAKFMHLFDILDKMPDYEEKAIVKSGIVSKTQLSNLKAYLYKQILFSLRTNPINLNLRMLLREQLDFATILYHKGLFKQSLRLIDKAKKEALENEEKIIAYEIIELEKVIESQYITRSLPNRAEELINESNLISRKNYLSAKFSNLSLILYELLLKRGYAKNENEKNEITALFNKEMPEFEFDELDFREKLWLYKSHLWYNFLIQDIVNSYRYAQKWLDLFSNKPEMIKVNPVWYIKGVNYFLEVCFLLNYRTSLIKVFRSFEIVLEEKKVILNDNNKILSGLCFFTHKLNYYILSCEFEKGVELESELIKFLKTHSGKIDDHYTMVLYYKMACLHFGLGNFEESIVYLETIISNKKESVTEELVCFARILNLISYYEAGIDDKLDYQIKSTYLYLSKMGNLQQVQKEIMQFLKKVVNVYPTEVNIELKKLHKKLLPLQKHPFEKRAFNYLDILSWIESKIENRNILDVIRGKIL